MHRGTSARLHNLLAIQVRDRWGFSDTKFFLNESGMIELSGSRYHNVFESSRVLPKLRPWMEAMVGLDVEYVRNDTKLCGAIILNHEQRYLPIQGPPR